MVNPLQVFGNGIALAVFVTQKRRLPKKSELDTSDFSAPDFLQAAQNVPDNHPLSQKLWSKGIQIAQIADLAALSSFDLSCRFTLVIPRLNEIGTYWDTFIFLIKSMHYFHHDMEVIKVLKKKVKSDFDKCHLLILELSLIYHSFNEDTRYKLDFAKIPEKKQIEYLRKYQKLLTLIDDSFLTLEAYQKLAGQFIDYPTSSIWDKDKILRKIYLKAEQTFEAGTRTIEDFNLIFEIIQWTYTVREVWIYLFKRLVQHCNHFDTILSHCPTSNDDWSKSCRGIGLKKLREIGTLHDWISCTQKNSQWHDEALSAMFKLAKNRPCLWPVILDFAQKMSPSYPNIQKQVVAEMARQLQ